VNKNLMSTIVLLALSMVLISPVKAITKETYTSHMELELIDPGIQWVSEGILYIEDSYWSGTCEGTLGRKGTYEGWVSVSINLATQEGTVSEKFKITITKGRSRGTLSGSSRGKITMPQFSGTFVATHGTGDFEGVKIKGSFEGFHPDLEHIVAEAEGTIKYP